MRHQRFYPMDDTLYAGDQVTVQLTYVNYTGQIVTFGDSFTSEQALAALYVTPR